MDVNQESTSIPTDGVDGKRIHSLGDALYETGHTQCSNLKTSQSNVQGSHEKPLDLVATALFEAIDRLYIGWPTRPDIWREHGKPGQNAIVQFASKVLQNTVNVQVTIVTVNEQIRAAVDKRLSSSIGRPDIHRISTIAIASDDCWLQDIGPVFGRDSRGKLHGVCFKFDAWGSSYGDGCYSNYERDAMFGRLFCARKNLPAHDAPLTLEGGGLSSNGNGTLLATRESILNQNRGNGSEQHVTEILNGLLGARNIKWIPNGALYDVDTNGHVDNMCVFTAPNEVLLLWADNTKCSMQHARSKAALAVLQAHDPPLVVHLVDAPPPILRAQHEADGVIAAHGTQSRPCGEALCASYVNIVIVEDVVFAPRFGVPVADERAYTQLTAAFRSSARKVVMVDARELVLAGGGLHCISLAQPVQR